MKLLFNERLFWHKIFGGLYKSFLFYENQSNVQILLYNFAWTVKTSQFLQKKKKKKKNKTTVKINPRGIWLNAMTFLFPLSLSHFIILLATCFKISSHALWLWYIKDKVPFGPLLAGVSFSQFWKIQVSVSKNNPKVSSSFGSI